MDSGKRKRNKKNDKCEYKKLYVEDQDDIKDREDVEDQKVQWVTHEKLGRCSWSSRKYGRNWSSRKHRRNWYTRNIGETGPQGNTGETGTQGNMGETGPTNIFRICFISPCIIT